MQQPLTCPQIGASTEIIYNPAAYARREGLDEAEAVLAHDQSSFGASNLVMALLTRRLSMHMTVTITVVLLVMCHLSSLATQAVGLDVQPAFNHELLVDRPLCTDSQHRIYYSHTSKSLKTVFAYNDIFSDH